MTSAPVASIIRQPHGPSGSTGFGAPSAQQQGSVTPEGEQSHFNLRRANTMNAPRHGVSASISSTPAGSSAFHGSRGQDGSGRFRSGSLSSSNNPDPGLVRKGSARAVRTEGVLPESSNEESATGSGFWAKGLSRQSSLPSRRGINLSATSALEPLPPRASNQPLRQQGRVGGDRGSGTGTPVASSTAYTPSHSSSLSLSSLSMFNQPGGVQLYDNPNFSSGASVSRTHSLRAQAKQPDVSVLGRSTSMKAAGEPYYRPPAVMSSVATPPSLGHSIDLASPPPNSSTAALPPYHLPASDLHRDSSQGADVRRHQSLNFGPSSRLRGRNDGASSNQGLLQRERSLRLGEGPARRISQDIAQAPTSPIGPSLWSPSHSGGDDGWDRGTTQQIQDAFNAMNLGISGEDPEARRSAMLGDSLRPQAGHLGEEPSWVANLVGGADRTPTLASRSGWKEEQAGYPVDSWSDPYASLGAYTRQPPANVNPRVGQMGGPPAQYMGQSGPYGTPIAQYGGPGQYQMPYPSFIPQAYSPAYNGSATPHSAPLADEDTDVVELSKAKGLNPATFNCRPEKARFFVIKSYTEDDVQKSLKHEIWSSTVLGNKRLDAAFRESSDEMPIYLFFSVNGSRHFCGVAEMLTRVDETKSSDVWSENNKWKGIFRVKWIFVRDVPSAALRHIRLLNTPEQKPITNSRDTQELHYEAGCEVLQIFLDHQSKSKTSLLQDYAHYERLSASRPTSRPSSAASHKSRNGGQSDYPQTAPPGQGSFVLPPQISYSIPPGALEPGAVPPVPPIPARYR